MHNYMQYAFIYMQIMLQHQMWGSWKFLYVKTGALKLQNFSNIEDQRRKELFIPLFIIFAITMLLLCWFHDNLLMSRRISVHPYHCSIWYGNNKVMSFYTKFCQWWISVLSLEPKSKFQSTQCKHPENNGLLVSHFTRKRNGDRIFWMPRCTALRF